jgi:hypothetical protein
MAILDPNKHTPENASSFLVDGSGWHDIERGSVEIRDNIAGKVTVWRDRWARETIAVETPRIIGIRWEDE